MAKERALARDAEELLLLPRRNKDHIFEPIFAPNERLRFGDICVIFGTLLERTGRVLYVTLFLCLLTLFSPTTSSSLLLLEEEDADTKSDIFYFYIFFHRMMGEKQVR